MRCPKPHNVNGISAVVLMGFSALLFSHSATAGDFRLGAGLGYGGAGVNATQAVNGSDVSVQRSEGPGTLSLFMDYLLSDQWSIGFEHNRGYRMAPFSTGASFTGLDARWFFLSPAPSFERRSDGPVSPEGSDSRIFIKRYSFFVGLAAGIAIADISRTNDQVPDVQGSGAYVGIKLGVEYPLVPGLNLRPEISSYKTIASPPNALPSSVSYFSFGVGFCLML